MYLSIPNARYCTLFPQQGHHLSFLPFEQQRKNLWLPCALHALSLHQSVYGCPALSMHCHCTSLFMAALHSPYTVTAAVCLWLPCVLHALSQSLHQTVYDCPALSMHCQCISVIHLPCHLALGSCLGLPSLNGRISVLYKPIFHHTSITFYFPCSIGTSHNNRQTRKLEAAIDFP